MRVLFVTPHYKPYLFGAERIVEQITKRLAQRADIEEVGILTSYYTPSHRMEGLPDTEVVDGRVTIYRIKGHHVGRKIYPLLLPELFLKRHIRQVMETFRPDIVQLGCDCWTDVNYLIASARRRHYKVTFSPSYFPSQTSQKIKNLIDRSTAQNVDTLISWSDVEKRMLQKAYRIDSEKVITIYNGISLSDDGSAGQKSPDKVNILGVGRFCFQKNQINLVKIFAAARSQFQKPTHLTLVGADEGGAYGADAVRQLVHSLGLTEQVTILPSQNDQKLQELYAQAHIFALFSEYESFGLSFVEAQEYSAPVLTWDTEVLKEVLAKGAVFVKKHDMKEAAHWLVSLVNDDAARGVLAQAARTNARRFSWERTVDQHVQLYKSLLTKI